MSAAREMWRVQNSSLDFDSAAGAEIAPALTTTVHAVSRRLESDECRSPLSVVVLCRKYALGGSGGSGSRRSPLKSILVIHASQGGLGQYSMITRNPVSAVLLHCVRCRPFGYTGTHAGVWALLVVMSHPLFENASQLTVGKSPFPPPNAPEVLGLYRKRAV